MALKKTQELPSGVVGEYWRIVEIHHNYRDNATRVLLQLYLDENARRAGKEPLPVYEQLIFTRDDHPLTETASDGLRELLANVYAHLKNVAAAAQQHEADGLMHLALGTERVAKKFADAEDC